MEIAMEENIYEEQIPEEFIQKVKSRYDSVLNKKNRELISYSTILSGKIDFLIHLRKLLKAMAASSERKNPDIMGMIDDIDRELVKPYNRRHFFDVTKHLDINYRQNLAKIQPSLTKSELRICELIKLQMSCKEIALTLNLSCRTVESHRLKIRKKIGLRSDSNLDTYLLKI